MRNTLYEQNLKFDDDSDSDDEISTSNLLGDYSIKDTYASTAYN